MGLFARCSAFLLLFQVLLHSVPVAAHTFDFGDGLAVVVGVVLLSAVVCIALGYIAGKRASRS